MENIYQNILFCRYEIKVREQQESIRSERLSQVREAQVYFTILKWKPFFVIY